MTRPAIWVTPSGEHAPVHRELALNGYKLTDMDRLAIVELITILARVLVTDSKTSRGIVFQGIPLDGLSDVDMIEMGAQAFSSLRWD